MRMLDMTVEYCIPKNEINKLLENNLDLEPFHDEIRLAHRCTIGQRGMTTC